MAASEYPGSSFFLSSPLSPVLASIFNLPHGHKMAPGAVGIMSTSQEKRKSRTKFERHMLAEWTPTHSTLGSFVKPNPTTLAYSKLARTESHSQLCHQGRLTTATLNKIDPHPSSRLRPHCQTGPFARHTWFSRGHSTSTASDPGQGPLGPARSGQHGEQSGEVTETSGAAGSPWSDLTQCDAAIP